MTPVRSLAASASEADGSSPLIASSTARSANSSVSWEALDVGQCFVEQRPGPRPLAEADGTNDGVANHAEGVLPRSDAAGDVQPVASHSQSARWVIPLLEEGEQRASRPFNSAKVVRHCQLMAAPNEDHSLPHPIECREGGALGDEGTADLLHHVVPLGDGQEAVRHGKHARHLGERVVQPGQRGQQLHARRRLLEVG